MQVWERVLDSIPGLLCCVVDLDGILLYATQGYKAIALRLFGHKCDVNEIYPPDLTDFDDDLAEAVNTALSRHTTALEVNENNKSWIITIAPLKLENQESAGVIIRITPGAEIIYKEKEPQEEQEQNLEPEDQEDQDQDQDQEPDILNLIPMPAIFASDEGICLGVNKFSESILKAGDPIQNIIDKNYSHDLKNLIVQRSGVIECKIPDIIPGEYRLVKIHAENSEYQGQNTALLIFEDITELQRARDQIHRLMKMDTSTGFLNRQGLEHFILQYIRQALNKKTVFSVIAIELSGLKKINSEKGYAYGDKIINSFAETLRRVIKNNDYIAGRWGGNDFMLLAECPRPSAKVIAADISEEFITPDEDIKIFFGTAEFETERGIGVRDLVAAAWDDLNEIKKNLAE